MTVTTTLIALNKLDQDPANVRKTYRSETIAELAAAIAAEGMLQNLVVRGGEKKGRYYVTAGERRRRALLLLVEQGKLAKDAQVECKIKTDGSATEISLMENISREDMHPADQFVAFNMLAEEGKSIADIAARFGVSDMIVRRRLALAKVSPKLLDIYREGKMTLEQLTAFTINDDHARQEQVWDGLGSYKEAHSIKHALTTDEVSATDKRVRFIGGLATYEAHGGSVRRDLFSENEGGYAGDVELLERLVLEKLEETAAPFREHPWKFVEISVDRPDWIFRNPRVYPQVVLSEDEAKELEALEAEYEALETKIEAEGEDEAISERLVEVEAKMKALSERPTSFLPEDMGRSGVVAYVEHNGTPQLYQGVVKDEDVRRSKSEAGTETDGEDDDGKVTHSATLIEDLTAQKTAILRAEFTMNADVALVAVVHALLLRVAYRSSGEQSALQLHLTEETLETSMKQPQASKALQIMAEAQRLIGLQFPADAADLFDWMMDQNRDKLLKLLAYAASFSINAVEKKFTDRKRGIAQANQLARALNVNVGEWFETTADTYFNHLTRPGIEAALAEVKGHDFAKGVTAMKKTDAAAYAATAIAGTGWLPEPIRVVGFEADEQSDDLPMAAE